MNRRLVFSLCALLVVAACEGFGTSTRKQNAGICNSDRDCLYGLICRGTPVGVAGERRCIKEKYSRCGTNRDCYAGRICNAGYCETQCVVDADCVATQDAGPTDGLDGGARAALPEIHCVVGECRTGSTEQQCLSAADCAPEQDCVAGRCGLRMSERCASDFDCSAGRRCIDGSCR
jgi:hypothetical protein